MEVLDNMFRTFQEIEKYALKMKIQKKIVLCGAHDEAALGALVSAKRKGLVSGILIGDEKEIKEHLIQMGESLSDYEVIHECRESASARMATRFVKEGHADIQMKGNLQSATYLMPIMTPSMGLVPSGGLLSETTAFYYPGHDGIMFATDCAMTIAPSLEDKVKLINNAVTLAKAFGYEKVRVAVISALEKVSQDVVSTLDAEKLVQMEWGDTVIVDGPFALDNALDKDAAKQKKIQSDVAGRADILLMPELCTGNVFHKCIHFLGHLPSAGVVCGTTSPVVFTSRTDSEETKYYSILSAILQSLALR